MITFFAHIRIDCMDRAANLQTVLNYYSKNFPDARFSLVEDDSIHNPILDALKYPKGTSLNYMQNKGVWYKTAALNYAAAMSQSDIIVQLDIDCIFNHMAIRECVETIEKNPNLHYGFPYNGYVIDVNYDAHKNFIDSEYDYNYFSNSIPTKDLPLGYSTQNFLVRCTNKDHLGVGGMVVFKKNFFLKNGGYNPRLICWGADDNEIDIRFQKLGLNSTRITRDDAVCYHLPHANAIRFENPYYDQNYAELEKVKTMSSLELKQYISTWKTPQ